MQFHNFILTTFVKHIFQVVSHIKLPLPFHNILFASPFNFLFHSNTPSPAKYILCRRTKNYIFLAGVGGGGRGGEGVYHLCCELAYSTRSSSLGMKRNQCTKLNITKTRISLKLLGIEQLNILK